MSTDFIVHRRGPKQVVIVERSSLFDLDLINYDNEEPYDYSEGPQQMDADEAIHMATGILYAVWCSNPEKIDAWIESMHNAGHPAMWNRIRKSQGGTDE